MSYSFKPQNTKLIDIMGKKNKNPFNYKSKTSNRLLLVTDLMGEIIHVIGNPRIIGSSIRKIYLQNFFNKFLSKQSRQQLYDEIQSTEVLPLWINSRIFKSALKGSKKNIIFKVHLYRTFIKFATEIRIEQQIAVNILEEQKQFEELRNSESIEEAIIVYIEPVQQRQSPNFQEKVEQNQMKTSNLQSAILGNNDEINLLIFSTPQKKRKNFQGKDDHTTNGLPDKFKDAN